MNPEKQKDKKYTFDIYAVIIPGFTHQRRILTVFWFQTW
jgi:hypothetical protein